jgi:hypothetical protein
MNDAENGAQMRTADDSGEHDAVDSWVDTKTAAQIIGFTPGTLRNWRQRKQGPPFSVAGGNPRYRISDLHAWMREGQLEARSGT